MLKGDADGVQYWAVGSGNSSWDVDPVNPSQSETTLTNEIGRVALSASDLKYLNPDYTESDNPTNILQIKHTFGENDCNGQWREFGIFGGNATAETDSGIMINKKHHALITKASDMTIDRTMRFVISFV